METILPIVSTILVAVLFCALAYVMGRERGRVVKSEKRIEELKLELHEAHEVIHGTTEELQRQTQLNTEALERSRSVTAPEPPWENGLYRTTRAIRIGERRFGSGVLLFTSDHHVLDSVSAQNPTPTHQALNRDGRVDRDLRRALRRHEIEMVASADQFENVSASLQQVFRGFHQSMEHVMGDMQRTLQPMFRGMDASIRQLEQMAPQQEQREQQTEDLQTMIREVRGDLDYAVIRRGLGLPANPEAVVETIEKAPEEPDEPERPSRYDRLVDDNEVV